MGILSIFSGITGFFGTFWFKLILVIALLAALIGGGGYIGWKLKEVQYIKQTNISLQSVIDQRALDLKKIAKLQSDLHDLQSKYQTELNKNQTVVTKYVVKTITKEIHDHPDSYACRIPINGMRDLSNEINALNAIRGFSPVIPANH